MRNRTKAVKLGPKEINWTVGIPTRVLKEGGLGPFLQVVLFTKYIKSVQFPFRQRLGRVTPVDEKGPPSDPTSFRSVTVLSILSKVFEFLINDHIVTYIEDNKLFYSMQFSFVEVTTAN